MSNKFQLNHVRLFRTIFFAFITCVAFGFLIGLPRLAVPLSLAYIFALILNPFLPYMSKLGLSRTYSIIVILLGLSVSISYPIFKLIPIIKSESENFRYYIPTMESYVRAHYQKYKNIIEKKTGFEIGERFLNDLLLYGQAESKLILLKLPNFIALFFEWLFLIPLFIFFILKDGIKFKYSFLSIVPNPIFERFYFLVYKFNKQLGDYIFAKFVEASIIGLITTLGLIFLNVKFAFILGGIAALTNIVPYVGPVLGIIPAILVCLIENNHGPILGATIALYFVANIIDLAFVFPVLVSKIVDIHPIIVVISVILGSQYFGVVGMIISIPLAAIAKLIFMEIYRELYPSAYKRLN